METGKLNNEVGGQSSPRQRRKYPSPEQVESYLAAVLRCGLTPKSVWLLPNGALGISEQETQSSADQAEDDIQAWERRR